MVCSDKSGLWERGEVNLEVFRMLRSVLTAPLSSQESSLHFRALGYLLKSTAHPWRGMPGMRSEEAVTSAAAASEGSKEQAGLRQPC